MLSGLTSSYPNNLASKGFADHILWFHKVMRFCETSALHASGVSHLWSPDDNSLSWWRSVHGSSKLSGPTRIPVWKNRSSSGRVLNGNLWMFHRVCNRANTSCSWNYHRSQLLLAKRLCWMMSWIPKSHIIMGNVYFFQDWWFTLARTVIENLLLSFIPLASSV